MNYQKIYDQITAKDMIADYTEKHHIIPRCMGGSDDKENLVILTPEAHYVAHQLLVKIYPDNHKLIFAANMMTVGRNTNKSYGWVRRKHAQSASIVLKGNSPWLKGKHQTASAKQKISNAKKGENNPMFNKTHTELTKQKISIANKGKNNPRFNVVVSAETRKKLSDAKQLRDKEKYKCKFCGKELTKANINRWHDNKCKYKP